MKILYKILSILLVMSIIPLLILGITAISTTQKVGLDINDVMTKTLDTQAKESMSNQAKMLANHAEAQLQTYMNDIKTISKHPDLMQMMRDTRDTGIMTDTRNVEGLAKELQVANHYPVPKTKAWNNIQDYFMSIINDRVNDIDLIRVFYKDGYIANGVSPGKEDIADYKGDKSWFSDTMNTEITNVNDYYVSPISIARQTNSPSIRYMAPIEVDNSREGLIIINFKSSAITNEIQNFEYGDSGYAMFIDAHYENAEGVISDFPVVISKPTEDGALYYIKEDVAAPVLKSDLNGEKGFVEFSKDGRDWVAAYDKVEWEGKLWYVLVNVPKDEINQIASSTQAKLLALISKTKTSLISIILVTIILIGVVGYFFAQGLTKPMKDLVSAGNKIADGNLDTEVPVIKSKDEVAELGMTVNMLVGALKFLKSEKPKKK